MFLPKMFEIINQYYYEIIKFTDRRIMDENNSIAKSLLSTKKA